MGEFGISLVKNHDFGRFFIENLLKLILTEENDAADKLYEGIEIPNEILQPKRMENPRVKVYGFTGRYPKLWPFEGPKSDQ